MRSLVVAMNERDDKLNAGQSGVSDGSDKDGSVSDSAAAYTLKRVEFTKEDKKNHTILAPQIAPVQFEFVEAVFHKHGYRLKLLKQASRADIECGLKYVNNDACFPTIIVVGQMINAVLNGDIDPDNTTLAITQTGGGCAHELCGIYAQGSEEAGYPQIPVLTISAQQFEKNAGFEYTPSFILDAIKALCMGDMLTTMLLRTRPYEKVEGSANALYSYINQIGRKMINPKSVSR